ncbi:Gypsy retrotransposon integrase-like protein 1, partial [Mucuna pruriens]
MADALATLAFMFEMDKESDIDGEYPIGATENNKRTLRRLAGGKEAKDTLEDIHEGIFGTHASGPNMARKILKARYYWLKMEADCCEHVKRCHKCQIYVDNIRTPPTPLNMLLAPWPFAMWGIDVIRPIEPKASNGHRFILVVIDYFTKWVKASSYPSVTKNVVVKFIKRDLICRYGVPSLTDNGANLNNKMMMALYE